MDSTTQHKVIYSGRVQGVGFRYTVSKISQNYPVSGYVKNLANGTVELVTQCDEQTFQKFHDAISKRFKANITDAEVQSINSPESFETFTIQ